MGNRTFWGKKAAGCLFLARTTKRFGFALRSSEVLEPFTYGTCGGAIDGNETPGEATLREVHEEIGDFLTIDELIPLKIFRDRNFVYYNFLAIVEEEFDPDPDAEAAWEIDGFEWVAFGDWPKPLHFGCVSLLRDKRVLRMLRDATRN